MRERIIHEAEKAARDGVRHIMAFTNKLRDEYGKEPPSTEVKYTVPSTVLFAFSNLCLPGIQLCVFLFHGRSTSRLFIFGDLQLIWEFIASDVEASPF